MGEGRTKRKLAAIFSADVKGYSRLMADNEEATVGTINSYRDVMTNLIQGHNGRVVDAKGDNVLAEFASVVDAVRCATEVQSELKKRNAELPVHRRMEFRIGVNLGDVIEEGETIYGDGVNVASRLEGLADAGGICISGTAFDQVRDKLDLGYEYLGEQSVKNIPRPVRAYNILLEPEYARKVIGEERLKARQWRWAAIAIVLILTAGAFTIWNYYFRAPHIEPASKEKMAFPLPDKPSIAVLPFDNLSGDPKQEYFADGMSEDVITDLSKIPGLLVISRNSSFIYKGKSVKTRQIAKELGVRYVLEGSVRRVENRVRINAQLIDSTTGHHLWADRYDENIRDIFALQDKITQKIVTTLALKLTEDKHKLVSQKETNSVEAYDAFLKGSNLTVRLDPDLYAEAIPWLEKAIELDPNYSRAYAALAETYWYGAFMGIERKLGISYRLARIRSVNYLEKALKNPTSIAHRHAAFLYAWQREHEKALVHAMRAVALDPADGKSNQHLGFILCYLGKYDEAVDFAERSQKVDPKCFH